MKYNDVILEHFYYPRHVGSFADHEPGILTGKAGNRQFGDELQIQLKVADHSIVKAKFKAYGCVPTIAAGSFVSEWLQGKTLAEAETLSSAVIMKALALPAVKRHCALLAEDAVKHALLKQNSTH